MAGRIIEIGNTFDSIDEAIDCFQSLIQRLQEYQNRPNPPAYLCIKIEGGKAIQVENPDNGIGEEYSADEPWLTDHSEYFGLPPALTKKGEEP